MDVCAIVPVKRLCGSKTRLSKILGPKERQLLTLAMLNDVLSTLRSSAISKATVIGSDSSVNDVAAKFNASYIKARQFGLNSAVKEATDWLLNKNIGAMLVLPADIPLVSSKDVNRIIELGASRPCVVLSPSHDWGTSALLQNPPDLIPPCFGPGCFIEHIHEAYKRGISVRLHFSPGLSADVDSVQDLRAIFEIENDLASWKVLKQVALHNQVAHDYLISRQHFSFFVNAKYKKK
jgi:2-phospho-L-lactate guanylyltransferase